MVDIACVHRGGSVGLWTFKGATRAMKANFKVGAELRATLMCAMATEIVIDWRESAFHVSVLKRSADVDLLLSSASRTCGDVSSMFCLLYGWKFVLNKIELFPKNIRKICLNWISRKVPSSIDSLQSFDFCVFLQIFDSILLLNV